MATILRFPNPACERSPVETGEGAQLCNLSDMLDCIGLGAEAIAKAFLEGGTELRWHLDALDEAIDKLSSSESTNAIRNKSAVIRAKLSAVDFDPAQLIDPRVHALQPRPAGDGEIRSEEE